MVSIIWISTMFVSKNTVSKGIHNVYIYWYIEKNIIVKGRNSWDWTHKRCLLWGCLLFQEYWLLQWGLYLVLNPWDKMMKILGSASKSLTWLIPFLCRYIISHFMCSPGCGSCCSWPCCSSAWCSVSTWWACWSISRAGSGFTLLEWASCCCLRPSLGSCSASP